jgi:putative hemolysin
MDGLLEIGIILLLALLNGVFAMSELAVVSARKLRLVALAERGKKRAKDVLDLLQEPDNFLSTVQIGITLVGVGAGAFGGATLSQEIAGLLREIAFLAPYARSISVGLVIVLVTYLSLVLGELVPKQIALSNPERYAMLVARPLEVLSRWMKPLVRFLSFSTGAVIRLTGIDLTPEPELTEADIRETIDQASLTGLVTQHEETMLEGVLNLSGMRVETLITPRAQVVWLDLYATQEELRQVISENHYERYPVARDTFDQVVGVVSANTLLEQYLRDGRFDLNAILEPPVFVPDSVDAYTAMTRMQQQATGIIFVLNEFGGVDGIVTQKDFLETIAGDMPEYGDTFDPQVTRREDGSLLCAGMLPLGTFLDLIEKTDLYEDLQGRYQTLGGLIMGELGHIPHTGELLEWEGLRLEVVDMDGKRVDKVLVSAEGDSAILGNDPEIGFDEI